MHGSLLKNSNEFPEGKGKKKGRANEVMAMGLQQKETTHIKGLRGEASSDK